MTIPPVADLAARRASSARMNALIRGEQPAAPDAEAVDEQGGQPTETGSARMNALIRGEQPVPPDAA